MAGFDKTNIKCLHGSTPTPFLIGNVKVLNSTVILAPPYDSYFHNTSHKDARLHELQTGTLLSGKFCSSTVGVRSSSSSSQPELGIGWGTTANNSVQDVSEIFAMPVILEFFCLQLF